MFTFLGMWHVETGGGGGGGGMSKFRAELLHYGCFGEARTVSWRMIVEIRDTL